MAKKVELVSVGTKITKPMRRAISRILEVNAHANVSDYIRDLIRRDLEKRGLGFEVKKED